MDVVKAGLTGAIIANLLLAMGLAILVGGLRYNEQTFQPAVARINSSSLTLAVIVVLTPAAIQFTSDGLQASTLNNFSYAASILLLTFYCLMLLFSMKTHKYLYLVEGADDEPLESSEHKVNIGLQVVILLTCTVVLVFVSDILVESLGKAISTLGLTSLFTG